MYASHVKKVRRCSADILCGRRQKQISAVLNCSNMFTHSPLLYPYFSRTVNQSAPRSRRTFEPLDAVVGLVIVVPERATVTQLVTYRKLDGGSRLALTSTGP